MIPRHDLKPFRFQHMWTLHPNYLPQLANFWSTEPSGFEQKLVHCQHYLHSWNHSEFGNLFTRKKRLLGRLQGIQRALAERYNPFLISLEHHLLCEYNSLLAQEETFWRQKSRVQWLKEGDMNTRFFHLTTVQR